MFKVWRDHIIPVFFLILLTFAVYVGILGHDFITSWDDNFYVVNNTAIRGFSLAHIREAFSNYYAGNYAPVQILSYMVDYTFWGMRPVGYFLTNILFHVANGVLFYWLLFRLYGRKSIAFIASCLFLLHPVQVESVAWVSQRKNLLAMFFFLWTFHFYLNWCQKKRHGWSAYAAALVAYILALLSKVVVVFFPLALLLFNRFHQGKEGDKRKLFEIVPFFLVAVVAVVMAHISQVPDYYGGGKTTYHGGSPYATALTMIPVFARYIGMLFWPLNLSGLYAPKIMTGINVTVVFSSTVLLMIGFCGSLLLKRRKDLFFWFAFFFLGLLPVAQIIPLVSLMNDRYLYFPMIGVATLAALWGFTAADNWPGTSRKIGLAGTVLVIGAFSVISWQRTRVWQNQDTFWADVYQKSPPGSYKFWMHLATSQFQAGETTSALINYRRAIDCDPANADGWLALARAEEKAGNLEAAAQAYHNVTIHEPEDYQGWQGLREIEQRLGKEPKP